MSHSHQAHRHTGTSNPFTLVLAEGRAAVVAYDFQIDFEAGGRMVQMSGRDLMTLEERDGRWWLVADHFLPYPDQYR